MLDIFHEIDEDLRHDRMMRLWRAVRIYVFALAVAILVGTAGWRIWHTYIERQSQAAAGQYEQALQAILDHKPEDAMPLLEAIKTSGPKNYRFLAELQLANLTAHKDMAAARESLEKLKNQPHLDPATKDLLTFRLLMLSSDTYSYAEFTDKLKPFLVPENAFRNSARELLALAALKNMQPKDAGNWLDSILSDAEASPAAKRRAELLLAIVQTDLGEK